MKKKKSADLFHYLSGALLIIFAIFVVLAAYFSFVFGRMVFTDEARTGTDNAVTYEITITKGESPLKVGNELEQNGIIESGLAFFVQTKLYGCSMPVGTFTVSSSASSKAIAKYLNQEYINQNQEESE